MKTLKIIVHGKVQGVGYRYYTKLYADEIGIKGTVRNLSDGTVEVYASGDMNAIQTFIESLYKGSPFSRVSHLESQEIGFIDHKDFDII
ncbi:acylphosphatase [Acidaminobacter sp. JC074]|uniref:acylphosphatase n=1 Tax=Acidaminobacter sp. JC074 TaxID=2530199 RepID=UPI001F0FA1A5|nr:acylphosphatase [Acidaminobacter sp. JC074]